MMEQPRVLTALLLARIYAWDKIRAVCCVVCKNVFFFFYIHDAKNVDSLVNSTNGTNVNLLVSTLYYSYVKCRWYGNMGEGFLELYVLYFVIFWKSTIISNKML